jgi:flavorubredoxin
MITNTQSNTRVDEIADRIYRISTPVTSVPGGFTFNQYLVVDDDPLLFHTGPRKMFPLVAEAIGAVMAIQKLRWISFSHVEADECGSLNELLAAAPASQPLTGQVATMVSVDDLAVRPGRGLANGEMLSLGRKSVTWHDAPHVPHGWDCGYLSESTTSTLFCGDLFTQGGADHPPVTDSDILEPSEGFRKMMDYYSHTKNVRHVIEQLAATNPRTLACMHGAAWRGNGAALLRSLGGALAGAEST